MTQVDSVHPSDDAAHRGRATLAIASLAVLATFLDTTVLFVAFGDIAASFPGVSIAHLSWILNAYTITFAALLVPAGRIADRVGHKTTFLVGSALFTMGSVACGLAGNPDVLVAFRIVQALGAAALVPSSFALVLRAFPAERIPFAVAVWGAAGAVAGALGPTVGASLIELWGWRSVFLINLPIGIATVALGSRHLLESRDTESTLPSPVGVVTIAVSAALLSLGIVQSDEWGWTDARTLGALAAGALGLLLFVLHERVSHRPTLDLALFSIRDFRWAVAATLVFGTGFTAMFFGSILFLTDVWGWSTMRAGLAISPGPLVVALTAPRFGRLAGRIGQRPLLLLGGPLFALGGVWRIVFLEATPDYVVDYLPSMLLTGLGVAMCFPQLSSVAGQALPPNRLGVGGAVSQAVRQFGGTFGVALTIALVGGAATATQPLSGFDDVWWLIVAGGIGTALLSTRLQPRTSPASIDATEAVAG